MFCHCIARRYKDPIYQSILVQKIVNRLIRHGKKSLAYRILYSVLYQIQEKTQRESLAILEYAVRMVTPKVQLRTRRVGGANYQVPKEVDPKRGITLAIQWILRAARNRPVRGLVSCLSIEVMAAACGNGGAIRKRDEIHRIADANKAFARYRFLNKRSNLQNFCSY